MSLRARVPGPVTSPSARRPTPEGASFRRRRQTGRRAGISEVGDLSSGDRSTETGTGSDPALPGYDLATGLGTPLVGEDVAGLGGVLGQPMTLSPSTQTTWPTTTPIFRWTTVQGATSYLVTVQDTTTNTSFRATVYEPMYVATTPLPTGDNLTWTVAAVDVLTEHRVVDGRP